jgi:hypothetical protein
MTTTDDSTVDDLAGTSSEHYNQNNKDTENEETWTSSDRDGNRTTDKKRKNARNDDDKKFRQEFIQKYHEGDFLAEAVIVGRKPYFAVASPKLGNPDEVSITLQESIPLDENTTLKPYELTSYINKPYVFKSKEEFEKIVDNARNKNLETYYIKSKSIWRKYVDTDDFHISICAADTIFTYFQDKIGLTHYLFFVGGPDSGKSNNLTVLHFLAYRNMTSSDITSANIYQFLGSREEGIGTICEDEADNIDEDREKMKINKNGYTTGHPVHRTDTSFGRKQLKFNTFCFKAFAAERLPDLVKAKGFNQRTIELPCIYGFPQYDISEVANPAGEEEYEGLLDELIETRNDLLVYRLLHFKDKIPDIKLNIHNREKQLFKPVIRLFQNTKTLEELLPVISKYISQRREKNANSLHAFLYRIIKELVVAQNTYELESSLIWDTVKELPGNAITGKPLSYESVDFGVLSQKEIIQTLKEVFWATPPKHTGKKRTLVFDKSKLDKLDKIHGLSIDIRIERQNETHEMHETHVGLDRHIFSPNDTIKIETKEQHLPDNSNETEEKDKEFTSEIVSQSDTISNNVSQASQASQILAEEEESKTYDPKSIYGEEDKK